MSTLEKNSKISSEHLVRKAIVYIRQSTAKQVRNNHESQRLQYALSERAAYLGCAQVQIIDKDLGISAGAGARQRPGFHELLANVALGDVGIILSRELSRLSRHVLSRQDYQLLIETTAKAVDGRVPLVAGIIANSTEEVAAHG